jgi:hypothetical protein
MSWIKDLEWRKILIRFSFSRVTGAPSTKNDSPFLYGNTTSSMSRAKVKPITKRGLSKSEDSALTPKNCSTFSLMPQSYDFLRSTQSLPPTATGAAFSTPVFTWLERSTGELPLRPSEARRVPPADFSDTLHNRSGSRGDVGAVAC